MRAGLRQGDIIKRVNDTRITSTRDLSLALRDARGWARLTVLRGPGQARTNVYVNPDPADRIGIFGQPTSLPDGGISPY